MRYNDGENWVIVEDEQDLELAYACASRSDNKITFTISSMKGQKRGPKAERKKKEKFMGKSVPRWAFRTLSQMSKTMLIWSSLSKSSSPKPSLRSRTLLKMHQIKPKRAKTRPR